MPDLGEGSEAVANYIMICNSTADSYPKSIAHGLQKDAIQNSLDARASKDAVCVEFEVTQNGRGDPLLTFTDNKTTGLTGDVVRNITDYRNLKKDDHWARFGAFAFTKDDPDALGARGQGKFIFLRASKQYKMFYDTRRADGVYRLGATQATETSLQNHPKRGEKWEGQRAKDQLRDHCGLEPLEQVGTRIIVCDPMLEVLDEIKSGEFELAIQETWFRAIEKNQLKVRLKSSGISKTVGLPPPYPHPTEDQQQSKTWIYGRDFTNPDISSADGNFKIKNFCAAYLPGAEIQEGFRGIAIIQNGMKVCSLDMTMAPPEIQNNISGYIEFDKELDRELRKAKNQDPNHYGLKWRSAVPRAIKYFVNHQFEEFGCQKLGIREDKREAQKRRRNNAENEALKWLLRYAHDIDLRGAGRFGPGREITPPPSPPPNKEIGLMVQMQFPDPEKKPRVDWGENLLMSLRCFNKTTDGVKGLVSARVLQADACIKEIMANKSVELQCASGEKLMPYVTMLNNGNPFEITIDQSRYKNQGEYRIRITFVNEDDGSEIDARTVKFWVAEDPPRRMPFKLIAAALPTSHAWQPSGDIDDDPTIHYNTNHPQYKFVRENEEMHAEYLFDICLEGALHFVLTRPRNEQGVDYCPLDTDKILQSNEEEVPEVVFEEIRKYISEVRWRRFQG